MTEFNQITASSGPIKAIPTGDEKRQSGLNFKVYQELKSAVHRDLLNKVDLERVAVVRDERTRAQALAVIQDLVANLQTPMSGRERERLSLEVLDEVFGLGPLEPLLQDPTINDILVNGHNQVYVERAGLLEETNIRFKDNAHLMHIIDKIVESGLKTFYTEVCLLDQAFIHEPDKSVAQSIKQAEDAAGAPIKVAGFIRYALGEGIDRPDTDFAAEVAAAGRG